VDQSESKSVRFSPVEEEKASSFLADFYAGLEFNPRVGLFDFKMFLYLVGAVILECVLLSAAIHQYHALGRLSLGLTTYLLLFSFFIAEYMYHEVGPPFFYYYYHYYKIINNKKINN
jgi:hypothetical protein